jgi:hypothetical protein
MTQPNFLIIGAPKCGTTALYAVLARHPQIYMSQRKEPFFFAFENLPPDFTDPGGEPFRRHAVTDWESYQTLFAGAASHSAVGEASALYLTHFHPERTAENIRRRLPVPTRTLHTTASAATSRCMISVRLWLQKNKE